MFQIFKYFYKNNGLLAAAHCNNYPPLNQRNMNNYIEYIIREYIIGDMWVVEFGRCYF